MLLMIPANIMRRYFVGVTLALLLGLIDWQLGAIVSAQIAITDALLIMVFNQWKNKPTDWNLLAENLFAMLFGVGMVYAASRLVT